MDRSVDSTSRLTSTCAETRDRLRHVEFLRGRRVVRAEPHEIAGLRTTLDDALALQQQIRAYHGRDRNLPVLARLPHGRHALARPEHAAPHVPFDLLRQFFVELQWMPLT
jgi:hypothetical protein